MQNEQASWLAAGLTVSIILTALTALMAYATYAAVLQVIEPGDLEGPTHLTRPAPKNLSALTEMSSDLYPALYERSVTVQAKDIVNFRLHLEEAARRNGWLAYRGNSRSACIIMPVQELDLLDGLENDPTNWATTRTAGAAQSIGPANLDLVKVKVRIVAATPLSDIGFTMLAIICFIATAGLLIYSTISWTEWVKVVRHKPTPSTEEA